MQTSLIDFSESEEITCELDGNTQKTRLYFEGCDYILKYGTSIEPNETNPQEGSYSHTPISEWLGCSVFEQLGIPVQETLLGIYRGHEVVACKDFMPEFGNNSILVQFRSLENSMIASSERGRSPRLKDLERVFEEHPFFADAENRDSAIRRYWDTFVADSIIGNFDRHSGNWGYIADLRPNSRIPNKMVCNAPVYDCGSSFTPKLAESQMRLLASNPAELQNRALTFPKARLIVDGNSTIGYHELFMHEKGAHARESIMKLAPLIAKLDIGFMASKISEISDARRNYYCAMLQSRIECIVQPAYDLACQERGLQRESIVPILDVRDSTPWIPTPVKERSRSPRRWEDIKMHVSNVAAATTNPVDNMNIDENIDGRSVPPAR